MEIDPAFERAWNPRVTVPDFQRHLDAQAALAADVRSRLPHRADLRYGRRPLQTLDLFLPEGTAPASGRKRGGGGRPIAAFVHGGYWRALDKATYSFFAAPIVAAGGIAAIINYDLCPAVTVDVIVDEIIEAFTWLYTEAPSFGGDPERISAAGHSVGAHLIAMALIHDWEADDLPADLISAACLVAGIYDIAPVMATSINQDVRLDGAMAARNSPLLLSAPSIGDLLVAVGDQESDAFIGQSEAYAEFAADGGAEVDYALLEGENHFTVSSRFAEPDHVLTQFMLDQLG